ASPMRAVWIVSSGWLSSMLQGPPMPPRRMRRAPEDDYLHPLEADPTFNESRYYNFSGTESGGATSDVGGWIRMGNRPNEGHAEMTVCLYLPDGRVGFMFKRAAIAGHEAHTAAAP